MQTQPLPKNQMSAIHLNVSQFEPTNPINILSLNELEYADRRKVLQIIDQVCILFAISRHEFLTNRSRKRKYYVPRQFVYYFARKYTYSHLGLKQIAKMTWRGNGKPVDHSTVINAIKSMQNDIDSGMNKDGFFDKYIQISAIFEQQFNSKY